MVGTRSLSSGARSRDPVALPTDLPVVIASEAIAVGTLIAERPPHRTVRAAFPHTAPTLGG